MRDSADSRVGNVDHMYNQIAAYVRYKLAEKIRLAYGATENYQFSVKRNGPRSSDLRITFSRWDYDDGALRVVNGLAADFHALDIPLIQIAGTQEIGSRGCSTIMQVCGDHPREALADIQEKDGDDFALALRASGLREV